MTTERLNKMEDMLVKLGGTYILNHCKRVLHISKIIAIHESVDYTEDILIFASYFHDISAFKPYRPDGTFDHALESSKIMPELAKEYGFNDEEIKIIVETVKYHDKAGMGEYNETRLVRNADGIDYLGYMAVARDFSKQPNEMRKAIAALKKRIEQFYPLVDYKYALELAAARVEELNLFITRFEEESFGMY